MKKVFTVRLQNSPVGFSFDAQTIEAANEEEAANKFKSMMELNVVKINHAIQPMEVHMALNRDNIEVRRKPYAEKYLEVYIKNTGNSDGYVVGGGTLMHNNCGTLEDARLLALKMFMLTYMPNHCLARLSGGRGLWGEYNVLRTLCKEFKLPFPEEVGCSDCGNYFITFNNKIV